MATTTDVPATGPAAATGNDTRLRLVTAAARLVHAESYHSVGVKAICQAAGVRRGSFYHFFESKQALMLEALDLVWHRYRSESLTGLVDESLTPRRRIESMLEEAAEQQRGYKDRTGHVLGCTFGNLAAEAATLDGEIRLRLNQIFDAWALLVAEPLAEAKRRNEVDTWVEPLTAARDVVASLQGLFLLAKVHNDPGVVAAGGPIITNHLWGCDDHAIR